MSIPIRLLVHTVTLKQQKGVDRDRNPVYEESELQNVRVDVTRRLQDGQRGVVRADTMTLFVDTRNSRSVKGWARIALVIPKEHDAVVFEGRMYTVTGVTAYYEGGIGVHHYEVILK